MPAYPITTGDVAEVTLQGTYQGQTVLNVWHYVWTGPTTQDIGAVEVTKLAEEFRDRVWEPPANALRSMLVAGYTGALIKAQLVHPVRWWYSTAIPVTRDGAVAGDGIPSDTNITVSLRTERQARRGVTGNKKFTALALSTINGNLFTPLAVAEMSSISQTFTQILLDSGDNANWVPIVWSPRRPQDRAEIFEPRAKYEVRVLRRRQYAKGI